MISPTEIQAKARKLWDTGRPLRSLVVRDDEPLFPLLVTFRRPTAQEWLSNFAELRGTAEALHAGSKAVRGAGYAVDYRQTAHQKLGQLRVPERIVIESVEDLAECVGETRSLQRFHRILAVMHSREPRLVGWLAQRPMTALECEAVLPRLLDTVAYFQAHPRPGRFARELGIAGVDSKFIEMNRSVLAEWLDRVLPEMAIDRSVAGLADHGFERRYGLRFEEPSVRFRWLDPAHRLAGRISDAAVPLSELVSFTPECERVIITENKISFLTLPDCHRTLAIFGGGYAVDLLASVAWLRNQPLFYWGDLDTHGFAALSRLRVHWSHAQSVLMDRETLIAHESLWTQESSDRRCLRELPGLDEQERLLYDDLRYDRLGSQVRLEQERIVQSTVERALGNL